MRTYSATVKLPTKNPQKVTIQADNASNAKAMLEAQYGKGHVNNVNLVFA